MMQFCGFAAITIAVMQASFCKEGTTVTYIRYRSEGMDYGPVDCNISALVGVSCYMLQFIFMMHQSYMFQH